MSNALAALAADRKARTADAPARRPTADNAREGMPGGHPRPSSVAVGAPLQRKCACGGTPDATGECAGCRAKRERGAK